MFQSAKAANGQQKTDHRHVNPTPFYCKALQAQCTNDRLLSGNRLQMRYCGHPVAPLESPKTVAPIGKTRHLIIRSRLPLFRRPVRLTPQVSPVFQLNKALSICGLLQKGSQ
jgi:hypothetical protein